MRRRTPPACRSSVAPVRCSTRCSPRRACRGDRRGRQRAQVPAAAQPHAAQGRGRPLSAVARTPDRAARPAARRDSRRHRAGLGLGIRRADRRARAGGHSPWESRQLVATYHPSAAIRFGPQWSADGRPPRRPQDGRRAPGRRLASDRRPPSATCPRVDAMRNWAERLAGVLRAGDLLVLTGDLGAGKTTLTRGIGAASACAAP